MSRTKKRPWDYQRSYTPAQLKESDIQLEYIMLINKLEREYGIDRVAEIVRSWGKIPYEEKLEMAKSLEQKFIDQELELHDPNGS